MAPPAAETPLNQGLLAGGPVRVTFLPARVRAAPGNKITVTVQADNAANLSAVSPLRIKYDPDLLRLEDIAPGELFSRGGVNATAVQDIRNDSGEGTITVTRPPGAAGVSGSGAIAVFTFTAVGNGASPLNIMELGLKDMQSSPVPVTASALAVEIQ